jgi:hypothetical protein
VESIFASWPTQQSLFVIPNTVLVVLLQSFVDIHRTSKDLNHHLWTEVEQSNTQAAYFTMHAVNRCPFHSFFSAGFFTFIMMVSLFKMAGCEHGSGGRVPA